MARSLDVYLFGDLVGHLAQDDVGRVSFQYMESWLNKPGATPLSQSLPLRKERFRTKECHGFFAGILPEEAKREIIARNLGISARNDYAMLERIGGECAGAVTFMPAGQALLERDYFHRSLAKSSLVRLDGIERRSCLQSDSQPSSLARGEAPRLCRGTGRV
jgi:serine/threonine-protein kinase HipA